MAERSELVNIQHMELKYEIKDNILKIYDGDDTFEFKYEYRLDIHEFKNVLILVESFKGELASIHTL